MSCLLKFNWVKLPRDTLPPGKGLMGAWARLAARAAFRPGLANYCGYHNDVELASWIGGIVGLKSILNISNRQKAFPAHIAEELDRPLESLDALLSMVDVELSLGNRKLEGRLQSVQRSRLLLDRVNEALTMIKTKPRNGDLMYRIIYETYIAPEVLTHALMDGKKYFQSDVANRPAQVYYK